MTLHNFLLSRVLFSQMLLYAEGIHGYRKRWQPSVSQCRGKPGGVHGWQEADKAGPSTCGIYQMPLGSQWYDCPNSLVLPRCLDFCSGGTKHSSSERAPQSSHFNLARNFCNTARLLISIIWIISGLDAKRRQCHKHTFLPKHWAAEIVRIFCKPLKNSFMQPHIIVYKAQTWICTVRFKSRGALTPPKSKDQRSMP